MKSLLQLIPLSFLIITACSNEHKVNLVERNFTDEIQQNSILSFTFDKDLVPDSISENWSDKAYIEFLPNVKGKFHWQSSKILVFAPEAGFAPSTDYTCKLTNEILAHNKQLSLSGDREFKFHTSYLQLNNIRAFWDIKENDNEAHIVIDLVFNYPVNAQTVSALTQIEIENTKAIFVVIPNSNPAIVSLMITNIKSEDKDFTVNCTIAEGLIPEGGSQKTNKSLNEKLVLSSPFKIEILDMQAIHNGAEGIITLFTSQQIDAEQIKNYIDISPSVNYETEIQLGSFTITSSDFSAETNYELTLKKGLKGNVGGELKYEYTQPVSFGEVKPTIRFTDQKEFYVSGLGSRNIQATLLNVPKVEVKIIKIYENNILAYMRSNEQYYYSEEDYYYDDYYDYGSNNLDELGDVVFEKKYNTAELPKKGMNRILNLNFEDKLIESKGVYVVVINSSDDYWLRASKLICITDIGLMVKQGTSSITVFANSIKTATPLSNVSINFIGANNQVAYSSKTNSDGIAVYDFGNLKAPGFKINLITSSLKADYSVLPFSKTEVNTSRFDVGGWRTNPSNLNVFLYGDRDLYRPGETINLSAIVRDFNWQTPGTLPLVVKIINPQGKIYKTLKKVLNEQGAFEAQVEISSSSITGTYTVNVFTPNDVLVGSTSIKIEEFMPDRIKVNVGLNKEFFNPGETVELELEALNFFGPPAAGRNYEVEQSIQRIAFDPKQNNDYSYWLKGTYDAFSKDLRQQKTDESGRGIEKFEIPGEYKNMGILLSSYYSTVFDETGRPVNRINKALIYTQEVFFGIKTTDYYVNTGKQVKLPLIAVNKDGNVLQSVKGVVQLIKFEYKTVLSQSGDYYRYRSEKVERIIEKKNITLNDKNTIYSFVPETSGEYEVRLYSAYANTYVSSEIYAYGWGNTSFSSFKVNNEGQIDVQLDKAAYKVGEKAHVILKAPFDGKILVSFERDNVLKNFYVTTEKRVASFDIDLQDNYLPTFYISAILFKAHEVSDIPLTVAYGFAPVKVENEANKIDIKITAVEKSRSLTTQKIKINSRPNSSVTLAIVDEGILQVAGYSTPNPYEFFYQKRALEVNSYTIYPYLFPELGSIRSATGGDGSDMAKRINPMQNNRVKLVNFWSGIITTNSKGEAEYDIKIPQFSGNLRIMAVGYTGKSFGSAEANITVADPIVLSVALPRFLSPGDKMEMPVVITNTTAKNAKCSASIKLEGPLKLVGENTQNINIEANREGELVYNIEAGNRIGSAKVIVEVNAGGSTYINQTEITVRPASTLQKRTGSGAISGQKSVQPNIAIGEFIESSFEGKLVVSNNPLVEFSKSLEALIQYPHGCVEQTVSAAFPQLYFSDILGTLYIGRKAAADAGRNVQVALDRIKLMQLYDGGLSYWPGSGEVSWWGSVYACHFAIEAKKAGYEVDENFLKSLLGFLKTRLREKQTYTYYFNVNQRKIIAPQEAVYSLYVLALAGEKPMAMLNYYKSHTDELSIQGKYLLAGAFALAGDKQKYKEILPTDFNEKPIKGFGGSFTSYIRDEAIALNVILETDPDNEQVGEMAKHVSNALKNDPYLNTQELNWGLMAMGKLARKSAQTNIKGSIKADGKVIGNYNNNSVELTTSQIKGKAIEITAEGNGKAYYFWNTEGITIDGSYLQEDNYLKVRRNFYDRNGNRINTNKFIQNDLVLVEISIQSLTSSYVENIAITDILPACFEVENPRLTDLPPGMRWPNQKSYPDYIDLRDDRVNFFVNANQQLQYYYYLVRVVSAGTYNLGPICADAMYNGEYHSYFGADQLIVIRK